MFNMGVLLGDVFLNEIMKNGYLKKGLSICKQDELQVVPSDVAVC